MKRSASVFFFGILLFALILGAQTKPATTFSDYGQWESLAPAGASGGFSPDGRWLVYGITRSNRDYELRVAKLSDGTTKTAAFGGQPLYSSDSKWLAYAVGMSEADQKKLKDDKKPAQNKLGLMNLLSGEITTIDGIESFAFSPDGAFLAMKRYAPASAASPAPPDRGGRPGGPDVPVEAPGTTLLIRSLTSGFDATFGNIAQYAWQDGEKGRFLAMVLNVEGKAGNGVQLYDPESGILRVLESSAETYSGLSWRKDAADLAVFRAKTDEKKEGPTQVLLAWTGIGKSERRQIYDPTMDSSFPAGYRTVDFRRFSWSASGDVLYLGIAPWADKIAPAEKEAKGAGPGPAGSKEVSTVKIWHAKDVFVMPWQERHADSDHRQNSLAALHLSTGKLVPLGHDPANEEETPIPAAKSALIAEWSKYAFNRSIGRPAADIYLADIATGIRTKIREGIDDSYVQVSPGGKYVLFLQDGHFWTVNVATKAVVNITASAPVSFINEESDQTGPAKPPFGTAVWAKDDAAILLYDKYDLWRVAPNGSGAARLTNGAAEQIRCRLVRLDQAGGRREYGPPPVPTEGLDLGKPVYLSLFGEWTKKSGYARLLPGGEITRLLWLDRSISGLAKAKNAEVYGYILQDYDVSPNIYVGGPDLKEARKTTETNPFREKFAWGRSELIEYKSDKGRRLQAALIYPAGYEPGKKYPLIVYNYELLSQNVHNYVAPSERSYYNIAVFSANGYFVLEPDIVFRPRQPGWSVVECVTAGVKKVLEMGLVDPQKVGIVGHSMGGFNTSFVATHTDGTFAAAVAGAAMTDLVSYYGDHHWNSGIAETDHIETGQERMVVPLYEDLQAYIDNSATFGAHKMTVPLLLEVGDQDGTVAWHQGIELYNVARRAHKNVVMLAYMGEDHGLRQEKNQIDYQRRILAWFGHFLKGEPAESWITGGQTHLEREAEIKREKTIK